MCKFVEATKLRWNTLMMSTKSQRLWFYNILVANLYDAWKILINNFIY